ncbi:MAG TPA: glycosyltransferase family 4 protein [Candidatus Dormibacteraeota bacterium]|nr:glycosyltransferase family 4 protein [Candidatus Dormibacteraeota bacterium]
MKLLFVVQRYGREVFGGAEAFTRQLSGKLAGRGHQVEVLTSCAIDYSEWRNGYPAGDEVLDGVLVHRLPVTRPRDPGQFASIHRRVFGSPGWPATMVQEEWLRLEGPWLAGLPGWLAARSAAYDANIFVTYLYWPTWAGLKVAAAPTVLHPTAHDEPPAYLPLFDEMFRLPDAFGFLTPEEADFVRRRFRVDRPSIVSGIGIDLDQPGDEAAFRRRFGLGDDPYLACVGRTDPGKGSPELFDFFVAYRRRHPGPLKLVYIGEEVYPLERHPDVVMTGFVDEETRTAGIRGATVLVQPSYYESFSLVLVEAWAEAVPALVQGECAVLAGQCRRAAGGLPYRGYAEFEAAVELLLGDAGLRRQLGQAGRAYVRANYRWEVILERYEAFLEGLRHLRARVGPALLTVPAAAPTVR